MRVLLVQNLAEISKLARFRYRIAQDRRSWRDPRCKHSDFPGRLQAPRIIDLRIFVDHSQEARKPHPSVPSPYRPQSTAQDDGEGVAYLLESAVKPQASGAKHRFVMGLLQCQQKAHNITVEMPSAQAMRPPETSSQRLSNGSQPGRAGETQWQNSVHPPPCSNRSIARWTFGFCAKARPEDFSNLQIRNLLQRDHFWLRLNCGKKMQRFRLPRAHFGPNRKNTTASFCIFSTSQLPESEKTEMI